MRTKSLIAIVIFLLAPALVTPAAAQSGNINKHTPEWVEAQRYGGNGIDRGAAIKISRHGERYVTGSFSAAVNFGGNTLSSAGGSDMFLAKYARSGQLLWVVQAGGFGDDSANDLALDDLGNIYVTGWFVESASFRSANGETRTVNGSDESVFIAKYSPAGTLLWINTGTVNFRAINRGHGVTVDAASANVYVTGVSQGDTTFSTTDGTTHIVPGPGTWHMFLVKYNVNGNFRWGEHNEASPNSVPRSIAVDSGMGVYVTGFFEQFATFFSRDGNRQTILGRSEPVQQYPDYPGDSFVAKYDAEGNLQWVNDIGGYKANTTSIAASTDGRIAVTGFIGNINTGTAEQAETILTSQLGGASINLGGGHFTTPFNRDAFIAIYNRAGVLLEASRLGDVGQDGGSGVAFDRAGNLYVAGAFAGTLPVGSLLIGTEEINLFILKYGRHGLEWAKSAGGAATAQDFENNAAVTGATGGRVWVTGPFSGTAMFDSTILQSAGLNDYFVAELK